MQGPPDPIASRPAFPVRPMDVGDIMDGVFRIYRSRLALFLSVALLLAIPSLLASVLAGTETASIQRTLIQTPPGQAPHINFGPLAGALGVTYLVSIIITPVTQGALTLAAITIITGGEPAFGGVLLGALRRYFGLLALILINLVALIPIVTCIGILLTFWLIVRMVVGTPALLHEKIGPWRAVKRSWHLIGGLWWRTFGIVLLLVALTIVVNIILGTLVGLIVGLIPASTEVRLALNGVGSTIINVVTSPVLPIGVALVYFDLRARKEGLDLQQLAQQAMPGTYPAGSGWTAPPAAWPPPPPAEPPPPPPPPGPGF